MRCNQLKIERHDDGWAVLHLKYGTLRVAPTQKGGKILANDLQDLPILKIEYRSDGFIDLHLKGRVWGTQIYTYIPSEFAHLENFLRYRNEASVL